MFNLRKNKITICTDAEGLKYAEGIIRQEIKHMGIQNLYQESENKFWIVFETKVAVQKVADIFKKEIYKSDTKVMGNTILLTLKELVH